MPQYIFILDFGTNEEAAQQARHKVEAWQQGFRLGKKMLIKFEREHADASGEAAKAEPVPAVSVSVTCVPALKLALHVVGQLIPEGLLDTVPVPVPDRLTLKTGAGCVMLNVALTCSLALSVTLQVEAVPVHAPDQPVKDEFVAGVAVRVT